LDHNVRDILRCDDLSGKDIAARQESNRPGSALSLSSNQFPWRFEDWQFDMNE
jgi:hypothetical protein